MVFSQTDIYLLRSFSKPFSLINPPLECWRRSWVTPSSPPSHLIVKVTHIPRALALKRLRNDARTVRRGKEWLKSWNVYMLTWWIWTSALGSVVSEILKKEWGAQCWVSGVFHLPWSLPSPSLWWARGRKSFISWSLNPPVVNKHPVGFSDRPGRRAEAWEPKGRQILTVSAERVAPWKWTPSFLLPLPLESQSVTETRGPSGRIGAKSTGPAEAALFCVSVLSAHFDFTYHNLS